jgi:hypothetical protein
MQLNGINNNNDRILDLVLTNCSECGVIECSTPLVNVDAHHKPLEISMLLNNLQYIKLTPRIIKQFNKTDFTLTKQYLSAVNWESEFNHLDLDDTVNRFYTILNNCISKYVPCKTLKTKNKYPSWYSKPLIRVILEKSKAHKKWKRTGSPIFYDEFSLLRSRHKKLQTQCYNLYINQIESNIKSNPKALHSFIKSKKTGTDFPHNMFYLNHTTTDSNVMSELFNDFFQSTFINTDPILPHVYGSDILDISSRF